MHDPRLKGLAVGPESIFAVAEWDSDLVGCFGKEDRVFAVHPANEAQAFAWLASLRQRGIGWKAAEQQINAFLKVVGETKIIGASKLSERRECSSLGSWSEVQCQRRSSHGHD